MVPWGVVYIQGRVSVAISNIHKEPPNQVLWLRTILNKRALAPCGGSASIVINYSESNDVSSESHPLFSRSCDNHNFNLLKSASSLLILKCCLLANRFCKYFSILSRVRIGNVDVILPVYMILDNDMVFIALIPSGILLTGRIYRYHFPLFIAITYCRHDQFVLHHLTKRVFKEVVGD